MSLEEAVRKGLRSAKYLSIFMWGAFVLLFFIVWVNSEPSRIDNFEFMSLSFAFGCSLGMTAGWDTVRIEVKKILQRSDDSTPKVKNE